MGLVAAQPFLAVDGLLAQFAKRRAVAQARYARFVAESTSPPGCARAGADRETCGRSQQCNDSSSRHGSVFVPENRGALRRTLHDGWESGAKRGMNATFLDLTPYTFRRGSPNGECPGGEEFNNRLPGMVGLVDEIEAISGEKKE